MVMLKQEREGLSDFLFETRFTYYAKIEKTSLVIDFNAVSIFKHWRIQH